MQQTVAKLQEFLVTNGVQYGLNLLWAIVTFVVGRWVAKLLTNVVKRLMTRSGVDATLTKFASSVVYIVLMVFVVLAALGKLGVQTTSFVAILGAAGLAVGFALQGSLSNFAAGVMLIIFRPIKVGDFIEGGGTAGVVDEIGIFTTTLKTPDNKKIIVPNSKITDDNITNYSAHETRRVDLVIGVGYSDDLKQAKRVLRELLDQDERILKEPEPTIGVLELGDSSVNFAVRPWVRTADYWGVYFDLTQAIKERFDAEGISIPFPQRDIHVFEQAASA